MANPVDCDMILIFLTNMDNSSDAFEFVRGASLPMILGNAIAVGLSLVFVSMLSHERLTRRKGGEQIAQTFQRWLLACIVAAYLITSTFTFILQNGMAKIETQELFTTAINDVQTDIRGKSDAYMLSVVRKIADRYAHLEKDGKVLHCDAEYTAPAEIVSHPDDFRVVSRLRNGMNLVVTADHNDIHSIRWQILLKLIVATIVLTASLSCIVVIFVL